MRDGWVETTLGEVADLVIGRTPPRKETKYWTSSLDRPFCTIADMTSDQVDPKREGVTELAEKEKKARRVPAGALLMSFKLSIGRVGFAARDLFPNEAIAWVRPKDPSVELRYLALALETGDLEQYSGRAVKGKTLNQDSMQAIPMSLPPRSEQRRIVDVVSSVDAAIEAAETYRDAAARYRTGLLDELLQPQEGWVETTLGAVVSFAGGHAFPRNEQGSTSGEFPFYKVSDMNLVRNETTMGQSANWISESQRERLRVRVWPPGTVIFPKVGAALHTEKRRMLSVTAAFDNNIMGLIGTDRIDSTFLFFLMQTIRLGELAQEGALPSVNQSHLSGLKISLPPASEQRRIVNTVSSVDAVVAAAKDQLDRLRELRRNLLGDLLSGDHEIPDSYDRLLEVAS